MTTKAAGAVGVILTALLLTLATPPASAQTRSVEDPVERYLLPTSDLTLVRVAYGDRSLQADLVLRRVRPNLVSTALQVSSADGTYPSLAVGTRGNGRGHHPTFVRNHRRGSTHRCAGLRVTFDRGRHLVHLKVPRACLGDLGDTIRVMAYTVDPDGNPDDDDSDDSAEFTVRRG